MQVRHPRPHWRSLRVWMLTLTGRSAFSGYSPQDARSGLNSSRAGLSEPPSYAAHHPRPTSGIADSGFGGTHASSQNIPAPFPTVPVASRGRRGARRPLVALKPDSPERDRSVQDTNSVMSDTSPTVGEGESRRSRSPVTAAMSPAADEVRQTVATAAAQYIDGSTGQSASALASSSSVSRIATSTQPDITTARDGAAAVCEEPNTEVSNDGRPTNYAGHASRPTVRLPSLIQPLSSYLYRYVSSQR